MKDDWKGEVLPKGYDGVLWYLRSHSVATASDIIQELELDEGFNVDECLEFWRQRAPDWFQIYQTTNKEGETAYCAVEYKQAVEFDYLYFLKGLQNIGG